jgi:oxygen-independent coproporphyrinogen-3 oxidase
MDLDHEPRSLSTVFFGGGTPSLLMPQHVQFILDHVRAHYTLNSNAEITMESNPESLTREKAEGWRRAGVNRLSIGLQAMDDTLLKAMDRLHTVAEFQQAYHQARQAGFDNLNVDLIYGFPSQSLAAWQDTVNKTLDLKPEHVSMYALAIEEHTPFAAQHVSVNNDLQGDMYAWAREHMAATHYPQYEISNFALPGKECQHNLIYWRQQDYLAIGVGAVGCVGSKRWTNHKTLHAYEHDLKAGRLPRLSIETLSDQERRFEWLMLGLRLREGLAWGEEPDAQWKAQRSRLKEEGLLEEVRPGRWRIPETAVAFTNKILLPFIE